jgi:hypothetical protein
MISLSRLILIFALMFAILLISPALLSQPFGLYPLMKTGDVTDLLTPVILLPMYWLLFQLDNRPIEKPSRSEIMVFLVFTALWVEGQGMHLSANSIGHLLTEADGDVYRLTHFYDEVLSHYVWHVGLAGLTAALIWRQVKHPFADLQAGLPIEVVAATIYGLTYFIIFIEAGTTVLGVPFAAAVFVFGLMQGKGLRHQPISAFFFVGHVVAMVLFLVWFARWGGLPQFSELGWI